MAMTVLARVNQELQKCKEKKILICIYLRSGRCIRGTVGDYDNRVIELREREVSSFRRHFIPMSAIESIEIMDL